MTSGETLAVGSGGDQATFEADCFVIVGQDSYGDGWNGAEMTISTNGETVITFVVDASEASTEFCGESEVSVANPCIYPEMMLDCEGIALKMGMEMAFVMP